MAPSKGRIVALLVGGGSLIGQGLVTISGILMARMLGVEGRGQVVLILSLAAMVSQLTLGGALSNAVNRTLAVHGVNARDGVRHLVPRWTAISLAAGATAAAYFALLHRDDPRGTTAFLSVSVVVCVMVAIGFKLIVSSLFGEGAPITRVTFAVLFPMFMVTVTCAVAYVIDQTWTAPHLMALLLVSYFVSLVVTVRLLAPATHQADSAIDGSEIWGTARRQYLSTLGPIDGLVLDRTLVGSFLGNAALGLYSAAGALAILITAIGSGLAQVVLPRVAMLQGNPTAERAVVRRWLLLGAALTLVLVVGLELIAEPVIRIAFGREFLPAVECARWLIPAGALLGYRRILISVLQGRDRAAGASWVELSLTPVMIGGIVWSAHTESLVGVALTMLVTAFLACLAFGVLIVHSGRHPDHSHHDDPDVVAPLPDL